MLEQTFSLSVVIISNGFIYCFMFCTCSDFYHLVNISFSNSSSSHAWFILSFFHVYILIYFVAAILVLDLASILIFHKQHQNMHHVLQLACSQAEKSGVFTRILETFSGTQKSYALESYHAFMLQNRFIGPGCIFYFYFDRNVLNAHFFLD